MVTKLLHIIEGTFKNIFHIFNKESIRRYKICSKCPDKKHLKGFGDYCSHCGCIIKSKITVNNEKCPIDKW